MRSAHGPFERYRKAHAGRKPIPEALWKMAAELASAHGIFRTAQVLRAARLSELGLIEFHQVRRSTDEPLFNRLLE